MEFIAGNVYHIYNRGNNKEPIFFINDNYIYFLKKIRKYLLPHCEVLAYVLMPNHFHLMIHADERTEKTLPGSKLTTNSLAEGFRLMLSSYTKGINRQEGRTGNLIRQNSKSKCISDGDEVFEKGYGDICFHYIHYNPVTAGLAVYPEDWQYSSYRDYAGLRNGTLCNKELAKNKLDLDISNPVFDVDRLQKIW